MCGFVIIENHGLDEQETQRVQSPSSDSHRLVSTLATQFDSVQAAILVCAAFCFLVRLFPRLTEESRVLVLFFCSTFCDGGGERGRVNGFLILNSKLFVSCEFFVFSFCSGSARVFQDTFSF